MMHTVEKIVSISTIVEPQEKFEAVKDDPDDNKIIECAVAGKAEVILSQNKHLLRLKEFKGIKVITPEEFNKTY